jgi:hypothetical protein
MATHSLLAFSAAPVWANCSGSVAASRAVPDLPSPEAARGTAGHWVASSILLSYRDNTGDPLIASAYVGRTDPDGTLIDDEVAEGAEGFTRHVLALAQEFGGVQSLLIEHRVSGAHIHPEAGGTLDVALPLVGKDGKLRHLYLIDYKAGRRHVSPVENYQLIGYASSLLECYRVDGLADQNLIIDLQVYAPFQYKRDGPLSTWRVVASELRGHVNRMRSMAEQATNTPLLSAGAWCQYCPAVGRCDAAMRAGYNAWEVANLPYLIHTMDGGALATERAFVHNALALLKGRAEALDAEAVHRLQSGEVLPGLALQTGRSSWSWAVPDAVAIAMAAQFGIDAKTVSVKTPTQTVALASNAERVMIKEVLKAVTKTTPGTLRVGTATDSIMSSVFKPQPREQ